MNFTKTDIEVIRKLVVLKIKENISHRLNNDKLVHHADGYYFREGISTSYLIKLLSKVDRESYDHIQDLYSKYLLTFPGDVEQIKFWLHLCYNYITSFKFRLK